MYPLVQKMSDGAIKKIPDVAYHTFRGKFQEPSTTEGFTEVLEVPFELHFENAEQRKLFFQH